MKIKVFNIRLTKEHVESDQNTVNSFLENIKVKNSAYSLVEGKVNYWSVIIQYMDKKDSTITESDLTKEEMQIVNYLKQWRTEKSREENLPAYMVLSNMDIFSVAKEKPTDSSELLKVRGFGEKKVERYGDDIISLLNAV